MDDVNRAQVDAALTALADALRALADAMQDTDAEAALRAAATDVWACTADGRAEIAAEGEEAV